MRDSIKIPIFALILVLVSVTFLYPIMGSSSTTVYVYPSQNTVGVGQTFVIQIKISDVTDLYGWEFKLGWDPSVLDAVEITEGDFLKQGGGNTFFWPEINNTQGYILAKCTRLGEVPGVNGSGTLASVTFYAEKEGISILDLYDTKLSDSSEQPIPHTANDGNVTISQSVGGIIIPVDKLVLLAPWIGTGLTVVFALIMIIVFTKHRKKKGTSSLFSM